MSPKPDYLCFNLSLAMRRVARRYEQVLSRYGLTAVQFLTLSVLWREDGLKFKDLAERLAIEGPTLTGTLDRLERAGYVERRDDPEDRRSLRVVVTFKGWEIRAEAQAVARTLEEHVRSAFTEEEFAAFSRVLEALPERIGVASPSSSSPA